MHILLAEDNEANRILVRSLLEREGHKLDISENGLKALMRCEGHKYDLILMDILMPVMDGVKTLRRLRRSTGINARTPVFALTGYSSQTDRKRYQQVGFDLVLTKPLRPNDLMRAWNSYLKGDLNIAPASSDEVSQVFEDIPLIEEEIIEQLFLSGTPAEIRQIANSFWESTRIYVSAVRANLALAMAGQNEALTTLRQSVHGIKGAAATIGLKRLSIIAASLQNAPADQMGPLVLSLAETIKPSAQSLEIRIAQGTEVINTDSVEAHFCDANAPIEPTQTLSLQSKSQSPHKISTVAALQRQEQVP